MDRKVLSVSEVTSIVKNTLSSTPSLQRIQIRGEISNFKRYDSGHCYFTLKDEKSLIKSVMFRGRASLLRFKPENGQMAVASGRVEVYERDGVYQLYVDNLFPDGAGDLMLAYEQLKNKLQQEGLFAPENKKQIPFLPEAVGIITSSAGAVLHDIITVAGKRNPAVKLLFYPVRVQGVEAPLEILRAIKQMNTLNTAQVLIVGRGGGSLEELWAFNDERVVRAIAQSKIPIISAVGHETDFTLSDFVADLRAATPSQAAEFAVPDRETLLNTIDNKVERLRYLMQNKVNNLSMRLNYCIGNRIFKNPEILYVDKMQLVDNLSEQLKKVMSNIYNVKQQQFSLATGKLHALSPLAILGRGYSITTNSKGKVISDIKVLKKGEQIVTRLNKGFIYSSVESLEDKGDNDGEKEK